jgi:Protein of unknown function (DUF2585)
MKRRFEEKWTFAMKNGDQKLLSRGTLLAAAGIFLVFGGLLYLEGRPAWCKYGFGMWSVAWTHCTSQHVFDPYSLSHVLHGIIFFWLLRPIAAKADLRWPLVGAMILEIAWELLENSPWVIERYRQATASLDYTGDTVVNSIGDLISTIVGFAIASRVTWKVSLALFVIIELGLAYFIRDNLTLNVLMLFYPLESIKAWQLARGGIVYPGLRPGLS